MLYALICLSLLCAWRLYQQDRVLAVVRDAQAVERHEWAKERQSLLNRIQAPAQEVAVQVAKMHRSDEPLYVGFDDDDEFHEAVAS